MIHLMSHLDADVKILVDPHLDKDHLVKLKNRYKKYLSGYNVDGNYSLKRGVMVLISRACGYTYNNMILLDDTDTIQFDLISPTGETYNIVAIYATNHIAQAEEYFKKLHEDVFRSNNEHQIIIGDFNTTLCPEMDRIQYKKDTHVKTREIINAWLSRGEYIDSYRHLNPDVRSYTWRCQNKGSKQFGRLDYGLVTPGLMDKIIRVEHQYTRSTDHCSIIIEIDTGEERNGKGTFRAPTNIHNDAKYIELARECMIEAQLRCKTDTEQKKLYISCIADRRNACKVVRNNELFTKTFKTIYGNKKHKEQAFHDNLKYAIALSLEPTMDDINNMESNVRKGTELEMVLMELKQLTTRYAKDQRVKTTVERIIVDNDLKKAIINNDHETAEKVRSRIAELEGIHLKEELEKRQAFTVLEDERPSKAFLNMENRKGGYNDIGKLGILNPDFDPSKHECKVSNMKYSRTTNNQKEIRNMTNTSFQKIYDKQTHVKASRTDIERFLRMDDDSAPLEYLESKKISKDMADSMEGDLTMDELDDSLHNHMNGSSSPGIDGFTVNYLRKFWPLLKYLTKDALNATQVDGLTQTLKSAILKLLRKGEKDPLDIGNYRPISLLSIFYKLASCCITRRIKPAVESIIGKQQKAYIDKNNIGSCLINLLNMMEHVNKRQIPAIILLIDFSKAFDSIDHNYIQNVLALYGFGDNILLWIHTFFSDRSACVLMKGNFTDTIFLRQGIPQGDIISPYIFILAVEILLIKINHTKHIKGITFGKEEGRSETFADDTSIYMERKEEYLRATLKYLAAFGALSGLQCNVGKTRVIPIGNHDMTKDICKDTDLKWHKDFVLLGFQIDNKLENLKDNIKIIHDRVKKLINTWKRYGLTVHGRITIAKTMLLSQYTYVGSILGGVDDKEMDHIQLILNNFIQHNEYLDGTTKKNGSLTMSYMVQQVLGALT